MAVTFDNVITYFNSQLESLRAIFSHFETVIKSSHEHITSDAIEKEYQYFNHYIFFKLFESTCRSTSGVLETPLSQKGKQKLGKHHPSC